MYCACLRRHAIFSVVLMAQGIHFLYRRSSSTADSTEVKHTSNRISGHAHSKHPMVRSQGLITSWNWLSHRTSKTNEWFSGVETTPHPPRFGFPWSTNDRFLPVPRAATSRHGQTKSATRRDTIGFWGVAYDGRCSCFVFCCFFSIHHWLEFILLLSIFKILTLPSFARSSLRSLFRLICFFFHFLLSALHLY